MVESCLADIWVMVETAVTWARDTNVLKIGVGSVCLFSYKGWGAFGDGFSFSERGQLRGES